MIKSIKEESWKPTENEFQVSEIVFWTIFEALLVALSVL